MAAVAAADAGAEEAAATAVAASTEAAAATNAAGTTNGMGARKGAGRGGLGAALIKKLAGSKKKRRKIHVFFYKTSR
jgi:hypothetical protein